MWKESYSLGVEIVDKQHKELFERTEKLLNIIRNEDAAAKKQECIDLILFLKDYAVKHFSTEEEFQQSINYADMEAHKLLHKSFIGSVLELEQKMVESDFSVASIKEFVGFLMTWLIYHVAGADQDIVRNKQVINVESKEAGFCANCFSQSILAVLKTVLGPTQRTVTHTVIPVKPDDILIRIGLTGTYNGSAVFAYSSDTALGLIKAMSDIQLSGIDEVAYSALSEISNIVCGNAATLITMTGRKCNVSAPVMIFKAEAQKDTSGFFIDAECGKITVYIDVE